MSTKESIILVLIFGLFMGACMSTTRVYPETGRAIDGLDLTSYSPPPFAIGREKELNITRSSSMGIVPAPQLSNYLNGVLATIQQSSSLEHVPAQVVLRATPGTGALATGNATIYLDLGLLHSIKSEDQIAAILSHELAHILLGHPKKDFITQMQSHAENLSDVSLKIQGWLEEVHAIRKEGYGEEEVGLDYQRYAMKASTSVILPTWGRKQELQADVLAVDLMMSAGYNQDAMFQVLDILEALQQTAEKREEDQIAAIKEGFKKLAVEEAEKMSEPSEWLGKLKDHGAQVSEVALTKMLAKLEASHPNLDDRRESLSAYMDRDIFDADPPSSRIAAWDDARKDRETKQILANYRDANEASRLLAEQNLEEAVTRAFRGIRGATSRHSYPRFVLATIRKEEGKVASSIANLDRYALKGKEASGAIYRMRVQLYHDAGQYKEAAVLMEQAWERFGHSPGIIVSVIEAYHAGQRDDDAYQLASQCAIHYPEITDYCMQGVGDTTPAVASSGEASAGKSAVTGLWNALTGSDSD